MFNFEHLVPIFEGRDVLSKKATVSTVSKTVEFCRFKILPDMHTTPLRFGM